MRPSVPFFAHPNSALDESANGATRTASNQRPDSDLHQTSQANLQQITEELDALANASSSSHQPAGEANEPSTSILHSPPPQILAHQRPQLFYPPATSVPNTSINAPTVQTHNPNINNPQSNTSAPSAGHGIHLLHHSQSAPISFDTNHLTSTSSMPPTLLSHSTSNSTLPSRIRPSPAPRTQFDMGYDVPSDEEEAKSGSEEEEGSEAEEVASARSRRRRQMHSSESDGDDDNNSDEDAKVERKESYSSSSSKRRAQAATSAAAIKQQFEERLKDLSPQALSDIEAFIKSKIAAASSSGKSKAKRSSSSHQLQIEGRRGYMEEENNNEYAAVDNSPLAPPLSASSLSVSAPSPSHPLQSRGMQRDWNAEFQACFAEICNDATILDNVDSYTKISSLAHDFIWTATTLGRIIISEISLPNEQKTIPSISVGGFAGGLKYIAHNILFKFAVDDKEIYGDDQFAAKAAGHELLGLSNYYRTIASSEGRLGLHVPLAALIDFRGYRLYATCKLPIDGTSTLALGSMDGGKSIVNSNPTMHERMMTAAKVLNLHPHRVVDHEGNASLLPSCFDIEGHQGLDERFYLLDFHRTFPPEPPLNHLQNYFRNQPPLQLLPLQPFNGGNPPPASNNVLNAEPAQAMSPTHAAINAASLGENYTVPPAVIPTNLHSHPMAPYLKNTYLYRMLRPELVRSYSTALSSDVYSNFDRDETNRQQALECYRGLLEKVIPTFARALERNPPPTRFVDSNVQMQQQTANMIRTSSEQYNGQQNNGSSTTTTTSSQQPQTSSSSLPPQPLQSPAATSQGTPRMSRVPSLSNLSAQLAAEMNGPNMTASISAASTSITTSTSVYHDPSFQPLMDHLPPPLSLDLLSSVLHQAGINVRYLGVVRSQMRCESWRKILLVEILARMLKNELRKRWRGVKSKSMGDRPFRVAAVSFLNLVFFPSLQSNMFWEEMLQSQINLYFPGTLSTEETDPKQFNLKSSLQLNVCYQQTGPISSQTGNHHAHHPGSNRKNRASSSMSQIPLSGSGRATSEMSGANAVKLCPVHHAHHTHAGVDPSDPLSFVPPMCSAIEIKSFAASTAHELSSPSPSPTSSINSPSPMATMHRAPSLPSASANVPAPSVHARSVSTSMGYVKSAAKNPAVATGMNTTAALHKHSQSQALGVQTNLVSTPTSKSVVGTSPASTGTGNASSTSATSSSASRAKSSRMLEQLPEIIPCPGSRDGSCCASGEHVDYLLLLFMRFVQLTGVQLEDGVMEALQKAAENQAVKQNFSNSATAPPLGHHPRQLSEASELSRQFSALGYPDENVGEGSLQFPPMAMNNQNRQTSSNTVAAANSSAASAIAIHRSVTDPRANMPSTPPPLQQSMSTSTWGPSGSAQGMISRIANNTPSTPGGMQRNLSSNSLASQLITPIPISSPYRPSALQALDRGSTGGGPGAGNSPGGMNVGYSSSPQTPTTQSGRSTPFGGEAAAEGFVGASHSSYLTRSRSGSFAGANALQLLSLQQQTTGGSEGRGYHTGGYSTAGSYNSYYNAGSSNSNSVSASTSSVASSGITDWKLWSWPFVAPLEEMHVVSLVEKVKQVNLLDYAEGTSLLIKSFEKLDQHKHYLEEHGMGQKRLPGNLQSDRVFLDAPTPFLKMSFHLARLAATKYQQALKYCLDDNLTLCNLSLLMNGIYNKYSSATSFLKRAVQANSSHIRSWYYLGQLYHYHYKMPQEAKGCFDRALQLSNGTHANTLKDYGNLMQFWMKREDEAEKMYRRALQAEPHHIKSVRLLVEILPRNYSSLPDYNEIQFLLYDAARNPDAMTDYKLKAQKNYMSFLTCQADLYVDEYLYALNLAKSDAASKDSTNSAAQTTTTGNTAASASSNSSLPTTPTPASLLLEAKRRWREAIDFAQCPHAHYGSNHETGTSASATVANLGRQYNDLSPEEIKRIHNADPQLLQNVQFMVSSAVAKPMPIAAISSSAANNASSSGMPARSPSLSRSLSDENKKKAAAEENLESSAPAAGFSWCVCPDCCGVNFEPLPLAETLLSYAQFIHQYESIPPTNLTGAAAVAYTNAKLIEAEKYFQWSILVHHTLVASKKRHKQVQIEHEIHPERVYELFDESEAIGSPSPSASSATLSVPSKHRRASAATSSNSNGVVKSQGKSYRARSYSAHDMLGERSTTAGMYPFVPPAVKSAYLVVPPLFPSVAAPNPQVMAPASVSARGSFSGAPGGAIPFNSVVPAASQFVVSASNASIQLEVAAPYLTPAWLSGLGVISSFQVIVDRPRAVYTQDSASKDKDAESRLKIMTAAVASAATSVSMSTSSSAASVTTNPSTSSSTSGGPAGLARIPSSWDNSDPKKWQNMPTTIPGSTGAASGAAGSKGTAGRVPPEKEFAFAELDLEIDLEFDDSVERTCDCSVDHSFGEAATSCSCSFPSPRYLVSYAYFLLRAGRPAQAAYAFQSALVLHPFGKTGSSCLARMADCMIRAGVLTAPSAVAGATSATSSSGLNINVTNLQIVYGLFLRSVAIQQWEGVNNNVDDSIANKHIFIASPTAVKLFLNFIKEYGKVQTNISVPTNASSTTGSTGSTTSSGASTPTSTSSSSSYTSTSSVSLLKNVNETVDHLNTLRTAMEVAYSNECATYKAKQANQSAKKKSGNQFAMARVNTVCKCRRLARGKSCLCCYSVNFKMIRSAVTHRERIEKQRKAHVGFQHHDAATGLQSQQGRKGKPIFMQGQGSVASGSTKKHNASSRASSKTHRENSRARFDDEKPASGGSGLETIAAAAAAPTNEAPTATSADSWAGRVATAPPVVATIKRAPSNATAAGATAVPRDGAKDKSGPFIQTNSGGSTPAIATPVHASPSLAPTSSNTSNLNIPTLSLFPADSKTASAPTNATSVNNSASAPPAVLPTVVALPAASAWKAPPTLASSTSSAAAPATSTAVSNMPATTFPPTAFPSAVSQQPFVPTSAAISATASSASTPVGLPPPNTAFAFFTAPPPVATPGAQSSSSSPRTNAAFANQPRGGSNTFKTSTLNNRK